MSKFDTINIKVDGENIVVNIAEELEIADVSSEMTQVAAKMGYWGNVWGAAEEEKLRVDAHYRQWRAKQGEAAMVADAKQAEWKIKQSIEAQPDFLVYKEAAARAEGNVTKVRSLFEAFSKKANQLQSKGARDMKEFGAGGMTTRTPESHVVKKAKAEAGVSAMRELNKKKKAAPTEPDDEDDFNEED